jgi:hypothetical protein
MASNLSIIPMIDTTPFWSMITFSHAQAAVMEGFGDAIRTET